MSEKLNKKLHKVLEAILMLTTRIDNLKNCAKLISSRMDDLEKKFNEKFEDIHTRLNFKTDQKEVEKLKI